MKRVLAILCCISMLCSTALSCMVVHAESADSLYDLTVNQAFEPSGVETPITFGWKMNSQRIGAAQKAYALELATDSAFETVVWSTEAESGSSNAIPYNGNALESGTDYWWRVRVTNDLNETLEASSHFLTGLLSAEAHAGAAFIKNGETVADADLEYTVELDLYGGSRRTALVFNAIDAKNHYMWQLDFTDGATVNLKPHTCIDGAYTALSEYVVDVTEAVGGIDGLRKGVHLKIEATGESVVTYLDSKKVSEIPVSAFGSLLPALGTVGYRIHGTEYGYYDNLTVKRGDELLLSYDFNAYNPFEDGTVEGGKFLPSGTAGVFLVRHADVFRTVFTPEKEIADAKLFMSALGNYDAWLNGVRVGDQELKAGYSDPNTRQYYNTYDVTDKIENGANALSAVVTSGWWNGKVVSHAQNSGKAMAFRAILKITYADGTTENLVTDTENWRTFTFAPVLMGDIFNGETYDARISDGWKYAEYDAAGWLKPVVSTDFSGIFSSSLGIDAYARKDLERSVKSGYVYEGVTEKTTSQYGVVKKISTFGDEAFTLEAGQTAIIDLGQNAAGWEDLTLSGKAGTTVRIRHAEVLNEGKGATSRGNDGPEGSAYVSNLRTSAATTHYILSGAEQETYHPAFTFYGFRYLELTATDTITVYKVRGTVVTSALEDTGLLTTADADVNQLISNSKWGMYSNYLSVPTDCPQRDERAGWTADTQVFAVAGSYLNNSREFLRTFLQSMRDTQRADGAYRSASPTGSYGASFGALGWADAGVIIPYELWKQYGDLEIVREMYESMQLYVDGYLASTEKKGGAQNYGDHLAYEANDAEIKSMLGVSYYAYDARMMSEMAAALGKTEDAARYQELYQTEKNYFIEQYVNEDGTLLRGEQSVCLYALYLDLLPDEASFAAVKKQLIDNVSSHGNKLQTGFLGTKIILDVLTEIGETELAYKVLLQHDNPSWLYTVDQGATTMWENWNAYSIDSGFVSVGSGSFNHYAYGAVVGWMYRYMAGITPGSDGYKSFTLQPHADRSLGAAEAAYDSVYGTIKSAWSYKDDAFNYSCTVPANTNATIMVPVTNMETLIGGDAEGLTFVEHKDGYAVYTAVAGSYAFSTESKEENSVSVTVSNSDESILSYLLYDGNKYGWDTPIEVAEGTEITLTATAYNNVDYQMEWYDSNGKKLGLNTLTVTPDEDTAYVVKPVYVAKINLALHAAITASSTVNSSWPASTLTDGTLIHTSGSSRGWSSTKGTRGQTTFSSPITLTIDLGTETTFNQWKLYPRTYGFNANTGVYCFPEDYTVEISGDNSTWTTIKTVTDGATPDNIYQPAVDTLDAAVSGRYVRFSFSEINRCDDYGDCLIQLSEVAICHAVASEGTVEINLSNSDANVPAKVTYNDTEYVLPATLTVPKDEEVTLVAQMLNDVDYQAYFTDGTTTTDANTLTVTLQENAKYSVSGEMISGKNLAEGAAVSGEEANTSSWRIANLVDGTLVHTVSSARGWSSKGTKNVLEFSNAPKTVTLTMKNAVTFDQWKLYPRNYLISGIYCFPIAYTVEISTDNSTWTKVAEVTNGAVPENIYQPIVVDLNEAVTAQYVRFNFTAVNIGDDANNNGHVQLSELGLYLVAGAESIMGDRIETLNALNPEHFEGGEQIVTALAGATSAVTKEERLAWANRIDTLLGVSEAPAEGYTALILKEVDALPAKYLFYGKYWVLPEQWLVSDAEDLCALEQYSKTAEPVGYTFTQTADISMKDVKGYSGIGSANSAFGGIYDGGHYKITELSIVYNGDYPHMSGFGLFAVVKGAEIRNVRLMNSSVDVTLNVDSVTGSDLGVAGIIGRADSGTVIENCHNGADVTLEISDGSVKDISVAGVVGRGLGATKVLNCVNSGDVTAPSHASGINDWGQNGVNMAYTVNCVNMGKVTANAAYAMTRYNDLSSDLAYRYIRYSNNYWLAGSADSATNRDVNLATAATFEVSAIADGSLAALLEQNSIFYATEWMVQDGLLFVGEDLFNVDLNGDSITNTADVVYLLNGLNDAAELDAELADLNGDGKVSLADALKLLKMLSA